MSTIRALILFSAVVLLASCKEQTTQPVQEPSEFRHALMPLAVGNSWTYKVRPAGSDGTLWYADSQAVVGVREDHGVYWWAIGSTDYEMSIQNARVWTRSHAASAECHWIPNPSPGDTAYIVWQDVGGLPGTVAVHTLSYSVQVPAGIFDSCAVYECHDTVGNLYRFIFRPGVGVVQWSLHPSNGSSDALAYLTGYSIQQ